MFLVWTCSTWIVVCIDRPGRSVHMYLLSIGWSCQCHTCFFPDGTIVCLPWYVPSIVVSFSLLDIACFVWTVVRGKQTWASYMDWLIESLASLSRSSYAGIDCAQVVELGRDWSLWQFSNLTSGTKHLPPKSRWKVLLTKTYPGHMGL